MPRAGGRPIRLLACDDGAVESAGASLGLSREAAVPAFVFAVNARWNLIGNGLGGARRALTDFERGAGVGGHLRDTPPFLPVCLLLVLAASRMDSDAELSTTNYYQRLMGDLLERPAESLRNPEVSPQLFASLARWLAEDLRGERGTLQLPADPKPAYVGVPISQCVFRRRDRTVLYDFFDARYVESHESIDALGLLRAWPGRNQLTKSANRAIFDHPLESQVRAAIGAAHHLWDRTTLTADGHHRWRGLLRLRERPPVSLSVMAPVTSEIEIEGRKLRPQGEVRLDPKRVLPQLREGTLVYGGHDRVAIPAAGSTLVFEVDPEVGLVRTAAASAEHVHLLTCDRDLADSLKDYDAEAEEDLPHGWHLLSRVPRSHLPEVLKRPERLERPPVSIEGGLRVGRATYLVDAAPSLQAGQLDEDLVIEAETTCGCEGVNRHILGVLKQGASLPLSGLPTGTHRLKSTDGTFNAQIRLQDDGDRGGWGTIGWLNEVEHRKLRACAIDQTQRADAITGAQLSVPLATWPVLRPVREPVTLIEASGASRKVRPSLRDAWLASLDLPPDGRWDLDPGRAIWVIGKRDALCLALASPKQLDEQAGRALRRLPEHPIVRAPGVDRAKAAMLLQSLRSRAANMALES